MPATASSPVETAEPIPGLVLLRKLTKENHGVSSPVDALIAGVAGVLLVMIPPSRMRLTPPWTSVVDAS